jgi:hypothetical protein
MFKALAQREGSGGEHWRRGCGGGSASTAVEGGGLQANAPTIARLLLAAGALDLALPGPEIICRHAGARRRLASWHHY